MTNKHQVVSSKFYFLHIPKTAGTTVTSLLHENFTQDQVCPAYLWSDLLKIPSENLATYTLFRGHFYHYVDRVLNSKLTYLTFLRDPIERSISHYEHVQRESGHYLHHKARSQSLDDFLSDSETRPMIENFQTRCIALDLDPVSIAATLSEEELRSLTLERILESTMPDVPNQEFLERAKKRLDQFAFVGFVERFQESIQLLCRVFGWKPVDYYRKLNASPIRLDRERIPPKTIERIREYTYLDAELYRHAQQMFETRLNEKIQ